MPSQMLMKRANLLSVHIFQTIIKELTEGVGNTSIKCGVIGEIGCSYPLGPEEKKCLQAAGIAQLQTGAPLIIHPGRHVEAPIEIVRVLQEVGADVKKTVMSHLDRTLHDDSKLLELASSGVFLEYDLFGIELSYFQPSPNLDMMSDAQRIQKIEKLVAEGYQDKVLIAHDISSRHRLVKYGGHGYAHIQENVIPRMLERGLPQSIIDQIQIDNPRTWLTYKWGYFMRPIIISPQHV